MVVTTISCDTLILRCTKCVLKIAIAATPTPTPGTCTCGGSLAVDRGCDRSFTLRKHGLLIRAIAENKDGWSCEDRGGRDFCPEHKKLADPTKVSQPTPDGQFLV